jgi:hypothetical protein
MENSIMKTWLVMLVMILNGCVSTGIVSVDKDTFLVEKRNMQFGFGPATVLKTEVYREANEFCAKLNKKLETVNFEMTDVGYIMPGKVLLRFRCVRESAPK